ncbi:MAG: translocation/assembly module TamB domain-containing protein, partial [Chromatiaceae bacterium]
MRLRRRLLLGVLVVLGLPMLLLVLLLTAAATESGTRSLLKLAVAMVPTGDLALSVRHDGGSLLGRLVLGDLVLRQGGLAVSADRLEFVWRPQALWSRHLDIERLSTSKLSIVLPPSEATTEPGTPTIPDIALPVRVSVGSLHAEQVSFQQGELSQHIELIDLQLTADASAIEVALDSLVAPQGRVTGTLDLQPTAPHRVSAELSIQTSETLAGPAVGAIVTRARVDGAALRPQVQIELSRPVQARLSGALILDATVPQFDLTLDWPALRWPLSGDAAVSAGAGRLAVEGTADDYRLALRTTIDAPDLPATAELRVEGAGSTRALTLAPLELGIADASLVARGEVGWLPSLAWQLDLVARRLNPGLLQPDWPGALDAALAVSGSLGPDQAITADIQIERIAGVLREQPVLASGLLRLRGNAWQASGLALASGPNSLTIDGALDQRIDASVVVDAPDLAAVYPGLTGSLSGNGQVAGTLERPLVRADFRGRDIGFADTLLEGLELAVDWQASGGNARLTLANLQQGGQTIDTAVAELRGSSEDHKLQLTAEGEMLQLELAVAGGYAAEAWQGSIDRLSVEQDLAGAWMLAAPAQLRLGPGRSSLGDLCLEQPPARLCAQGRWQADGPVDVTATLERLALGPLVRRLSPDIEVTAEFAGRLAVTGTLPNPSATLQLRSDEGAIQVDDPDLAEITRYRAFVLDGSYANDQARARIGFVLGADGEASGSVRLGAADGGQRTLDGQLTAAFPDLGLIAGLVPAIEESRGRLSAALTLGGTLAAPEVTGAVRVEEAAARLPAAGLELEDIAFSASGDAGGGPITLAGTVSSGGGTLEIAGTANLPAGAEPAIDLRLTGDEFLASDLELAVVRLSPDLRIAGSGAPYTISGTLDIPRARLRVEEIPPSVIATSDDEIVVGMEETETPAPGGQAVRAAVTVRLGDEVSFEGFGLSTRLTGDIDAAVTDQGPRTDGKIQLRDGRYKAYGQDLDIERGELLFAGPADNPDVDLRAARVSTDGSVTAYLALSGTLRSPSLRVYTQPAKSDAEALAYLLTGRGLNRASRDQQVDIASAAL